MKSRTLLALGVASAFACTGAFAASGIHHSVEVQTPASVSESAPWLTGQSLASGTYHGALDRAQFGDSSVGSSAHIGGSGSVGYDSTAAISGRTSDVDYWLLGAEGHGTGSSSESMAGSGSVAFDSLTSRGYSSDSSGMTSSLAGYGSTGFDSTLNSGAAREDYAATEVVLVPAPLAAFDGDGYWTMEVTPTEESIDRLASVTDFYIITPIYEAMVDTSMGDSDNMRNDQLSLETSSVLPQDGST